ncbi:MAG TPA: protein translocase subunit SecD, partial [Stellaceae bacterium]|nr:protein translocase subunit SecD [Stellaceae bacterium]
MLYFQTWKVTLILGICLLGVLLTLPNLFSQETLDRLPGWVPHRQISLGLDLRGGSHLLLEVDMSTVVRERLNNALDAARSELRNARIGYTGLAVQNDKLVFTVSDLNRLDDVRKLVPKLDPELVSTIGSDGQVSLAFDEAALERRKSTVLEQSIEIVRRRIDETGTKEPTIQREGSDRILVQLPGIDNPEHVKELIGKTAKMTFQLVDTSITPDEARRGRLPPGDDILPGAEDPRHPGAPRPEYVVQKRVMVSG